MSSRHHCIPPDEFEGTQHITNFSTAAPWSQYNPRVESNLFYPYAQFRDARNIVPANNTTQVSSNGLQLAHRGSMITSLGRKTLSPTTPLLGASSTATASTLPPDTLAIIEDAIACTQCGRRFTGAYRSGNLARHKKQKHMGITGTYNCTVLGCSAVFQRSDARLKHARIKHPQLYLEGDQSEPVIEQKHQLANVIPVIPVAQELDYHVGQWLHIDDAWGEDPPVKDERHSRTEPDYPTCAAECVLATLVGRLSRSEYSRVCSYFFTRWRSIVQRLLHDGSSAYAVYAQVLEEIGVVIRANDIGCSRPIGKGEDSSRAIHRKRAEPRGNSKSEFGHDASFAASCANRITKPNERKKLRAGDPDKFHRLAHGETGTDATRRHVDCPVFKHHVMNNTTPPCRGCRVNVMAQIRSHLNPERAARTHGGYPRFVGQCPRCKQDFVDRAIYAEHSSANTCTSQQQVRGDIVLPWAKQYFTLYPTATRIPEPWHDSRGWLPDSILAQCRVTYSNSITRNALSEEPRIPPVVTTTSQADERTHSAAMHYMLHDLVSPTFVQQSTSPTPVLNPDRLIGTGVRSPTAGYYSNAAQYWQDILQNFERLQRSMREGAASLNPEQLRFMADESARMLDISQNILQHQSRATQPQLQSSVEFERPSAQVDEAAYLSPALARQIQSFSPQNYSTPSRPLHNHLATPSTDTLPSNRSYAAQSSQHAYSTPTNPSSGHRSANAAFLTPYSLDNRPTSLPPDFARDVPHLSLSVPGPRSLPGDGCINPAWLNPSSDNNDADYRDYSPGYSDHDG